jgi:integrase
MPELPKNVVKRGRSYYFRMTYEGREFRVSLGRDYQKAVSRAHELQEEVKLPGFHWTVNAFSHRWLSERIAQGRAEKSAELAAQRYRDYLKPVLGLKKLREVLPADFRQVRGFAEKKGLSPASVRHVLGDGRSLFKYAVECGLLDSSPFRSSVLPRLKEQAPKRLADEDVTEILAVAENDHRFAAVIALETGIRWGELHSLLWKQVRSKPYPHLLLENTKNGKVRRVPLDSQLAGLLESRRGKDQDRVLSFRMAYGPSLIVNKLRRRSGVRFHWHQFRHTFACRWLERGGSMESLQRILGHSSILVTQRYGALTDGAVYRELLRLEGKPDGTKAAQ